MKKIDVDFVIYKIIKFGSPLIITAYVIRWAYGFLNSGSLKNDFICFYNASILAASGSASTVYDFNLFQTLLAKAAGQSVAEAFFYPPTFLLILLPFSFLPYTIAFFAWMAVTLSGYCYVVYRIAPHAITPCAFLAFSPALLNISYGQNGFLSAAIMGGGLLIVDLSPFAGGLLLGLLTYKPPMAFLLLLALIAGRNWNAAAAFILSTGFMMLVSGLVFGFEIWKEFSSNIPIAVKMLETGFQGQIQDLNVMTSPYASIRLSGGSIESARVAQVITMMFAISATIWIWFKNQPLPVRASLLTLCTMIFTPHLHGYDMTLLALALAWMAWDGHSKGWLKGEKIFLFAVWFSPLIALLSVDLLRFQMMPFVIILFILFILKKSTVTRLASHSNMDVGN